MPICHHDDFLGSECGVIRKWWWRLGVFSLHRLRGRPHSSIGSHSLACWSNQLQNSIVAAAELQLSAYMHRKASSAVICPLDSRPPSHFTTPLPTATRVPDEERSIERRTRRGGREREEDGRTKRKKMTRGGAAAKKTRTRTTSLAVAGHQGKQKKKKKNQKNLLVCLVCRPKSSSHLAAPRAL